METYEKKTQQNKTRRVLIINTSSTIENKENIMSEDAFYYSKICLNEVIWVVSQVLDTRHVSFQDISQKLCHDSVQKVRAVQCMLLRVMLYCPLCHFARHVYWSQSGVIWLDMTCIMETCLKSDFTATCLRKLECVFR